MTLIWKNKLFLRHFILYRRQALFEQVHAAEDFSVFKRMMLRKNVELELQALEMIQKRNGVIPDILKPGEETKINYTVSAHAERDEEMLLQEVLR